MNKNKSVLEFFHYIKVGISLVFRNQEEFLVHFDTVIKGPSVDACYVMWFHFTVDLILIQFKLCPLLKDPQHKHKLVELSRSQK